MGTFIIVIVEEKFLVGFPIFIYRRIRRFLGGQLNDKERLVYASCHHLCNSKDFISINEKKKKKIEI